MYIPTPNTPTCIVMSITLPAGSTLVQELKLNRRQKAISNVTFKIKYKESHEKQSKVPLNLIHRVGVLLESGGLFNCAEVTFDKYVRWVEVR